MCETGIAFLVKMCYTTFRRQERGRSHDETRRIAADAAVEGRP